MKERIMRNTSTPDAPAGMPALNTTVATLLGRIHPEPDYWWDEAHGGGGEIRGWSPEHDQDVCWVEWSVSTTDDVPTGITITFYPGGYDCNWSVEELGGTTIDISSSSQMSNSGLRMWDSGVMEHMVSIATRIRKDNHR